MCCSPRSLTSKSRSGSRALAAAMPDRFRALIRKKSGHIGRLIRYGLVGSVVAALYSGFTILLVQTGLIPDPTLASAVSFCFTIPISFLSHRAITYADAVRDGAEARRFG